MISLVLEQSHFEKLANDMARFYKEQVENGTIPKGNNDTENVPDEQLHKDFKKIFKKPVDNIRNKAI